MALDIEVQEVRRAILTEVMWHRRERRFWLSDRDLCARALAAGHEQAIDSLRSVLQVVRASAWARDRGPLAWPPTAELSADFVGGA